MLPSSNGASKRLLGMTYLQLSILAALGLLFCLLLFGFIGLVDRPKTPLPTLIPTLPNPSATPLTPTSTLTLTPTSTPTSTPTATQTFTPTFTPTTTPTRTPSPTLTPRTGIAEPPDTTENIHVALIFNGSVTKPADELGKVDLVWGSNFPNQPVGVLNYYYYPFDRDRDPGTGGKHHDIAWFLANHPDWIEYTCDKETVAYEYGDSLVPLDITNPAVIDYMMQTYILPAIQKGYPGIAFDNVDFGNNGYRCGVWKNGIWVKQKDYLTDLLMWAYKMYYALHDLNISVAMNFSYDPYHLAESNELYHYMDIAVDEAGFTNRGKSTEEYYSGIVWLSYIHALQSLDTMGKGFVSINEMPEAFAKVSQAEKQWALANYLLVKGKYSYIAITGIQQYNTILITPEYSAPIGHALNPMYLSQGVFMRDFSNGKAIVNPSSTDTFNIILPSGEYQDLYGNNVDTLTLNTHSGIVLVGKTEPTSYLFSGPNSNYLSLSLIQISRIP